MVIGKNIHKYYGNVEVLKGVNLHIKKGKLLLLLVLQGQEKPHYFKF